MNSALAGTTLKKSKKILFKGTWHMCTLNALVKENSARHEPGFQERAPQGGRHQRSLSPGCQPGIGRLPRPPSNYVEARNLFWDISLVHVQGELGNETNPRTFGVAQKHFPTCHCHHLETQLDCAGVCS